MSPPALFCAIYALGLVWSLALGRRLGSAWCAAAAYPLGLVLWVGLSWLPAMLPLPFEPLVLAALWLAAAAAGVAALARRGDGSPWRPPELAALSAGAGLFAALAVVLERFDVSMWSYDSHVILSIGEVIAFRGGLPADVAPELASRGIFQVLVQAPSLLLGRASLWSAPPLLALGFAASFAVLGVRALDGPGRISLATALRVGLVLAVMASHYWLLVQAVYVHENFAAGVYLGLFGACSWLAEREEEPAWIPFAHLFLLGFALQRVETPLVAMLFLALAHTQSRLPPARLDPWLWATALLLGGWVTLLAAVWEPGASPLRPAPHVLDRQRAALMLAAIAGAALGVPLLRRPSLAGLRRHGPALLLAGLLAALLASLVTRPATARAATVLVAHMTGSSWGALWYAFALLALLSPLLPPVPDRRVFSTGSAIYLTAMALYTRGAHMEWSDSGNRSLTHLVPLLAFFFLLVYGSRDMLETAGAGGPRSPDAEDEP